MLNNALLNNFRQAQLPSLIEFYSESKKNVVFNFSKEIYKIFSIEIVSSKLVQSLFLVNFARKNDFHDFPQFHKASFYIGARWRFRVIQPIRDPGVKLAPLRLETTGRGKFVAIFDH